MNSFQNIQLFFDRSITVSTNRKTTIESCMYTIQHQVCIYSHSYSPFGCHHVTRLKKKPLSKNTIWPRFPFLTLTLNERKIVIFMKANTTAVRAGSVYRAYKKRALPVSRLCNRGPLKVCKDTKLINDPKCV